MPVVTVYLNVSKSVFPPNLSIFVQKKKELQGATQEAGTRNDGSTGMLQIIPL